MLSRKGSLREGASASGRSIEARRRHVGAVAGHCSVRGPGLTPQGWRRLTGMLLQIRPRLVGNALIALLGPFVHHLAFVHFVRLLCALLRSFVSAHALPTQVLGLVE